MAYKGVDYMDLDSELSSEERMARDTVRRFVDVEVLPVIEEAYLEGRFPKEIVPGLAELGVLGANLLEYGCAGMNNVAYGLIMQELERGQRRALLRLGAGRLSCTRSSRSAPRSKSGAGCRRWRKPMRSAASGSPRPTTDPIPEA